MALKRSDTQGKDGGRGGLFDVADGHDASGNGNGSVNGNGSTSNGRGGGSSGGGGSSTPPGGEEAANLHEIAQTRYLNYALSVITSRALPDVRDGMKPVQRRIIYT